MNDFCFSILLVVSWDISGEKYEKLGWSSDLKATHSKGRQKEIKENDKFRVSKKILFLLQNLLEFH